MPTSHESRKPWLPNWPPPNCCVPKGCSCSGDNNLRWQGCGRPTRSSTRRGLLRCSVIDWFRSSDAAWRSRGCASTFRCAQLAGERRPKSQAPVLACYDGTVSVKTSRNAARRHTKVRLSKATASEILSAVKVTPAEERRAKSAVAAAKRLTHRTSASVKARADAVAPHRQ